VSRDPDCRRALGRAAAARRIELGLTQEQLALRSDLHQRWISNVETGKRNPSYASLRRLAGALELPASELVARAETLESEALAVRDE
jgi:transcriptional regulator with XRE-family HTH domain